MDYAIKDVTVPNAPTLNALAFVIQDTQSKMIYHMPYYAYNDWKGEKEFTTQSPPKRLTYENFGIGSHTKIDTLRCHTFILQTKNVLIQSLKLSLSA